MSDVVEDFYDQQSEQEWQRLATSLSRLEFCGTLRLVEKYFPQAGSVCDVGGGPGRYTIELLRRGYDVTLVDLSAALLERARVELKNAQLAVGRIVQSNATDLGQIETGCYNAALMLGPLYHLVEPGQRAQALRELHRILRPGGIAIVAYLNSWGILRCGIADFPHRYGDQEFVASMLHEKVFKGRLEGFTECYWSTPPVALSEVKRAGFEIVSSAGAEGFVGGMRPMVERIVVDHPEVLPSLERMVAETCELPQYKDSTEHLCIVVRR